VGSRAFLEFPSVAQKQSARPISERPWSVTTPKDQRIQVSGAECEVSDSADTARLADA
jgi:hypothetical protein